MVLLDQRVYVGRRWVSTDMEFYSPNVWLADSTYKPPLLPWFAVSSLLSHFPQHHTEKWSHEIHRLLSP